MKAEIVQRAVRDRVVSRIVATALDRKLERAMRDDLKPGDRVTIDGQVFEWQGGESS